MALQDLRLTAINLATEAPCVTDFPLPPELQSLLGNSQGTYPFPSEELYQVAFESNQENVAEVLLVNSNASSMRIGITIVADAIGPRLRPYNLDEDIRVDLRTYIDNMYLCVTLPDNQDACEIVEAPVTTTDLEGLAMIINFAAEKRPFGTTTDIINDVSSVLLNTYGQFTVFVSFLNRAVNIFAPDSHLYTKLGVDTDNCPTGETSSFHSDYASGQCQDQIYHFWNYLTSFANHVGASPDGVYVTSVGQFADVTHECNGGGTQEDARLSSAALEISTDNLMATPANLANDIVSVLSSERPTGVPGALAWWYYHFNECAALAQAEWRDRNSGQQIPPELQCWPLVGSAQCPTHQG